MPQCCLPLGFGELLRGLPVEAAAGGHCALVEGIAGNHGRTGEAVAPMNWIDCAEGATPSGHVEGSANGTALTGGLFGDDAQDLAASVELLAAAIEAIPTDLLDQSDAERLVASLEGSLAALRRTLSHLRRAI
jgi:hypothetical protein